MALQKALDEIKLRKGSADRKKLYADTSFVAPMLDYIVKDFEKARLTHGDHTIGAMVICDSSEQAKMMHEQFLKRYAPNTQQNITPLPATLPLVAEDETPYLVEKRKDARKVTTATLILHDVGTKESRKEEIEAFKDGKIDLLIVFNMLLTGFDARRLKKLYLGRLIKAHNLLQALTRVNRTYKDFRYGYVVDFADISQEFDKTNKAYFDELQNELGDELANYSDLFKSPEEIESEIESIKDTLWKFNTNNLEAFSSEISAIDDRTEMLQIVKALNDAKALYNLIRLSAQYEQLEQLDFDKIPKLATMASDRLHLINQKIALESGDDSTDILKIALEDIIFSFNKRGEQELRIADEFQNALTKTRETLGGNFDPGDPVFISLKEELERLFKKKKLSEITQEEMQANIAALNDIQKRAQELNRHNQLLRAKYANDAKYARLHKRLLEKHPLSDRERKLFEALSAVKEEADEKVLHNTNLLHNEAFATKEMLRLVIKQLKSATDLNFSPATMQEINRFLLKEYLHEAQGNQPA